MWPLAFSIRVSETEVVRIVQIIVDYDSDGLGIVFADRVRVGRDASERKKTTLQTYRVTCRPHFPNSEWRVQMVSGCEITHARIHVSISHLTVYQFAPRQKK